jgi:hypothetical protein
MDEYDNRVAYDEIRRRINRRMWRWGSVAVHGILWVVGSGMLSIANVPNEEFYIVAWMGLVALHALFIGMMEWRNAALEHAIKRERERLEEKPKRGRLELNEDGELVDIGEYEDDLPKQKHLN